MDSLFLRGNAFKRQSHIQDQQDPDMTSAPPFEILWHFLYSVSYKFKQAAVHTRHCVSFWVNYHYK